MGGKLGGKKQIENKLKKKLLIVLDFNNMVGGRVIK